ncbi:MAG: two-component system, chemotaxis family, chemotaxis protein CheY [Alphaproteobacteria bacterium]|nr:two-component system, chemotaxis family, chemotaxis protein CheY [Alphaproteobacteria bacterium]
MDTSHSVLVVDDSHAMTAILRRLLHEIGYTDVDQVHDGGSALENLSRKPYGLMISDWEMPTMNGPQLVKAIRENPALVDPCMILITAHGLRQDEAWLVGADGYLSKPFTAPMLREKIEEVLSTFTDQTKAASWMAIQRS